METFQFIHWKGRIALVHGCPFFTFRILSSARLCYTWSSNPVSEHLPIRLATLHCTTATLAMPIALSPCCTQLQLRTKPASKQTALMRTVSLLLVPSINRHAHLRHPAVLGCLPLQLFRSWLHAITQSWICSSVSRRRWLDGRRFPYAQATATVQPSATANATGDDDTNVQVKTEPDTQEAEVPQGQQPPAKKPRGRGRKKSTVKQEAKSQRRACQLPVVLRRLIALSKQRLLLQRHQQITLALHSRPTAIPTTALPLCLATPSLPILLSRLPLRLPAPWLLHPSLRRKP